MWSSFHAQGSNSVLFLLRVVLKKLETTKREDDSCSCRKTFCGIGWHFFGPFANTLVKQVVNPSGDRRSHGESENKQFLIHIYILLNLELGR